MMNVERKPLPAPFRLLLSATDAAVIGLGFVILLVVTANIVLHQLGSDLPWTTELGEFVMVWATFLGGASAVPRGAHLAFHELKQRFHGVVRRGLEVLIHLAALATSGLLLWFGTHLTIESWTHHLLVLGWPMGLQYLGLPLASLLVIAFEGCALVQLFLPAGDASEVPPAVAGT